MVNTVIFDETSSSSASVIEIKNRKEKRSVSIDDIMYIDIYNRSLSYHLKDGTSMESTMLRIPFRQAVEQLLQRDNFVLCGVSMLVNLNYIVRVDTVKIEMKGDKNTWVYPPRSSISKIRKTFEEYKK